MSSSSRRVWVSRCRRPTGWAGRAGQRDVDDVGGEPRVELGAVELGLARLERRLDAAPRLVGRLADAPALLRRQLGDAAQQLRQLGLAPEVLDAHALELLRGAGAVDGLRGRLLDLLDAVDHRETSYIATVAAMAALSDSERIGMWQISSHCGEHRIGQPLALRADHERDLAGLELGQRDALARHEPDAPAGQLGDLAHARERDGEQRAHRRPHGLVAVGIGRARAERDAAGPERERGAQHRADVAGVVDAPQRDAQRPDRRGRPALAVDRERARARAELGDLGQQRLGDLLAREPGARPPRAAPTAASPRPRRRRAGPRPRPRTRPACRATCAPPACGSRVRVSLCGLVIIGSVEKKGARPVGGAPGASVSSALRPRTPRGRSGQSVGRSRHRARRCRPGPCGPARCRPA